MNEDFGQKRVAILGSTGSVGSQAFEALGGMGCRICFLAAGHRTERVAEQMRLSRPETVAVLSREDAERIREEAASLGVSVVWGTEAACDAIKACRADVILHSVAGLDGIPYAFAAAETGARLAMANKEVIIALGDLLKEKLSASGGELVPVDSEHSAVFQCLADACKGNPCVKGAGKDVRRVILTASGGPFFGQPKETLESVTPAMALAHPTWKMGPKITVDSATMMNKGFEVIEAARLFGVTAEQIDVLIHRQSVVHSMVEFTDRAVLAQLGLPDMRTCIRYAVSYPDRADVPSAESLDLTKQALTFAHPDNENFPLLQAAYDALRAGGDVPAALIAADEQAVAAFLDGKIGFCAIARVVRTSLERFIGSSRAAISRESVEEAVRRSRRIADEEIRRLAL